MTITAQSWLNFAGKLRESRGSTWAITGRTRTTWSGNDAPLPQRPDQRHPAKPETGAFLGGICNNVLLEYRRRCWRKVSYDVETHKEPTVAPEPTCWRYAAPSMRPSNSLRRATSGFYASSTWKSRAGTKSAGMPVLPTSLTPTSSIRSTFDQMAASFRSIGVCGGT